jgi:hypothetical protein
MLKVVKVVSWVLTIFFLLYCTVQQVRSWASPESGERSGELMKRTAERDSLFAVHMQDVLQRMDSIDARSRRIEALQARIPAMEEAINLNLRSKEELTTA